MSNKNKHRAGATESWRPVANPELAEAMRGLRRSGATTPYSSNKPRRRRTRAAANAYAIRDSRDQ